MCMWMQTGPALSHAALRSQGSSLHNGSPRLLRLASCLVRQAEERVCVCVFMCLRPPPSLSLSLCMCPALADFSLHCVCTTSGAIGVFIPSFVALFNALRRCHPALWARRRNEGIVCSVCSLWSFLLHPFPHPFPPATPCEFLGSCHLGHLVSVVSRFAIAVLIFTASVETLRWNDSNSRIADFPGYPLVAKR